LWILAFAALLLAPWPEAHLLLAPAVPTSLHQSPAGFTAQGIVRGQNLYQQYCLRCHGTDGRGEGPDAAQLPMWPPTLNGALLWKRLEGELFWRVRHGMTGRDSRVTMPGFDAQLSDAQVWDLLDFLQANASGQTLKESGVWTYPVRLPDAAVQCRNRHRTVRSLAGQRLLVAVAGPNFNMPADDPRLVTLQTGLPFTPLVPSDPECRVDLLEFTTALSLVLGVPAGQLGGQQLLTDKQGWLRARGQPGQAAWSEDDLICRTTAMTKSPSIKPLKTPTVGDGLDRLLRRMDAEPVRWLRGGFPH
jgi:mono/diheme cytochrome c family protein